MLSYSTTTLQMSNFSEKGDYSYVLYDLKELLPVILVNCKGKAVRCFNQKAVKIAIISALHFSQREKNGKGRKVERFEKERERLKIVE